MYRYFRKVKKNKKTVRALQTRTWKRQVIQTFRVKLLG